MRTNIRIGNKGGSIVLFVLWQSHYLTQPYYYNEYSAIEYLFKCLIIPNSTCFSQYHRLFCHVSLFFSFAWTYTAHNLRVLAAKTGWKPFPASDGNNLISDLVSTQFPFSSATQSFIHSKLIIIISVGQIPSISHKWAPRTITQTSRMRLLNSIPQNID